MTAVPGMQSHAKVGVLEVVQAPLVKHWHWEMQITVAESQRRLGHRSEDPKA